MSQYVELHRRFHELSAKELEDPEVFAAYSEHGWMQNLSWPDLLNRKRVLLLAEGGSGKSREMENQAKLLRESDKFAFAIPLELLADQAFEIDDESFPEWKAGNDPAWFFLDSVDELKLTGTKFGNALSRFSKLVGPALNRARILISSRPHDWQATIDREQMEKHLPLPPAPVPPGIERTSEEVFLSALSRGTRDDEGESPEDSKDTGILTVMISPLSRDQIRTYALANEIRDVEALLQEIDKENAWHFARRPLDLSDLVKVWHTTGRLGTRAEQHEANVIHKLRGNRERRDAGHLSEEQAREGAERLALAMTLSKRRNLRSDEEAVNSLPEIDDLDPASILPDWTDHMRQALLRRAIFQPAAYGRIRFHNRSVQEYLSAYRLHRLRRQNMTSRELFRLLFANTYGEEVVIPSMRPVAAWLALLEPEVCSGILAREPQLLLEEGDPGSLPLADRRRFLEAFVGSHGSGTWRGFSIAREDVQRLADPDLGPDIRRLWESGIENDEVREVLLNIVWLGKIRSCVDLASSALWEKDAGDDLKTSAVLALEACGAGDVLDHLARSLAEEPTRWSERFVRSTMRRLFPNHLSPEAFVALTETRYREINDYSSDPHYYARCLEAIDLTGETGLALMRGLSELILRHQAVPLHSWRPASGFTHLAPSLALVSMQQLRAAAADARHEVVRSLAIAVRFMKDKIGQRMETLIAVRNCFKIDPGLKPIAFESDFLLMRELFPTVGFSAGMWHRFQFDGPIGQLKTDDWPWLQSLVRSSAIDGVPLIAFRALLDLWMSNDRDADSLTDLRELSFGNPEFTSLLAACEFPPPPDPEALAMERENRRYEKKADRKEEKRLADWISWQRDIIAEPSRFFSEEWKAGTLYHSYLWLRSLTRRDGLYGLWKPEEIDSAFTPEVRSRLEAALKAWWRSYRPLLFSEQSDEEKKGTTNGSLYGLLGLEAEAADANWTLKLSADEAVLATIYATIELNSFLPYLPNLAGSHPAVTERVLGDELEAQFRQAGSVAHLPALSHLSHADSSLKALLSGRLLGIILGFDPVAMAGANPRHIATHLRMVFRILVDTVDERAKQELGAKCLAEFAAEAGFRESLPWLEGLFLFDPLTGIATLEARLAAGDEKARGESIELIAAALGERGIPVELPDPDLNAMAIARMTRLVYRFVKREEDVHHEDSYSPGPRDHAERARDRLLGALQQTKGLIAYRELLALAEEPDLSYLADRLRFLAKEKAAKESEPEPATAKRIRAMDLRYELPPGNQDELFRLMMDRLEELSHDLRHHDFSNRKILQQVTEEEGIQKYLAHQLELKANDCYSVIRETEMADRKRNDIQLSILQGNAHSVIEIKLANNNKWSVRDFERYLLDQLRGQYLRHENCTCGCMLLVYREEKTWRHPETREKMSFSDLIKHLQKIGQDATREDGKSLQVKLAVLGLDLSEPNIPSPHRNKRTKG